MGRKLNLQKGNARPPVARKVAIIFRFWNGQPTQQRSQTHRIPVGYIET